jgi:hypothetical protein
LKKGEWGRGGIKPKGCPHHENGMETSPVQAKRIANPSTGYQQALGICFLLCIKGDTNVYGMVFPFFSKGF